MVKKSSNNFQPEKLLKHPSWRILLEIGGERAAGIEKNSL
jgi:hypothetical protein